MCVGETQTVLQWLIPCTTGKLVSPVAAVVSLRLVDGSQQQPLGTKKGNFQGFSC